MLCEHTDDDVDINHDIEYDKDDVFGVRDALKSSPKHVFVLSEVGKPIYTT